jgi:hypothetical protein
VGAVTPGGDPALVAFLFIAAAGAVALLFWRG